MLDQKLKSKCYQTKWRMAHKDTSRFKNVKKLAANVYYHKHKNKNKEYNLFTNAKSRAKHRGIDFNLEVKDVVIPEYCPILGIKISRDAEHHWKDNSPSIDRIDNNKGYTKDNIQVISALANTMKNKATPEQLIAFAKWVNQTYGY